MEKIGKQGLAMPNNVFWSPYVKVARREMAPLYL
jgi:hypothetical protein